MNPSATAEGTDNRKDLIVNGENIPRDGADERVQEPHSSHPEPPAERLHWARRLPASSKMPRTGWPPGWVGIRGIAWRPSLRTILPELIGKHC
jgi:hypothetical protein